LRKEAPTVNSVKVSFLERTNSRIIAGDDSEIAFCKAILGILPRNTLAER